MGRIFAGVSSKAPRSAKSWALFDIDLINADLTNAFNCRVGERVMRPDYGCRIWDYFMEPLTEQLRELIFYEAQRICLTDGRVKIIGVEVKEIRKGVIVSIDLNYEPLKVSGTYTFKFEERQDAYYGVTKSGS